MKIFDRESAARRWLACALAAGPLSACGDAPSRVAAAAAGDGPVQVALGDETGGVVPLYASVAGPAAGLLVCDHDRLDECRRGVGDFLSADHARDAAGGAVFKVNVPVAPGDRKVITVVAFDRDGRVMASTRARFEKR